MDRLPKMGSIVESSRMGSMLESDSWTMNRESVQNSKRESVRNRRRSSAVRSMLAPESMDDKDADAISTEDSNKDTDSSDEFELEDSYLMYIYTFLNYIYVGNGKHEFIIIPLCQLVFSTTYFGYQIQSLVDETPIDSDQVTFNRVTLSTTIISLLLQAANIVFWSHLCATNQVKKVLMSVGQSKEERQGHLNLLAYCLIGSVIASIICTLPYCSLQQKFMDNFETFGYNGKGKIHLVRFCIIWEALMVLGPQFYIGILFSWVLYVSKKHFQEQIMDRIKYDNMPDVTDAIFSFYENTINLTSFSSWKYFMILRVILSMLYIISLFEMIYYLQATKVQYEEQKAVIVEYMGKQYYFDLVETLSKLVATTASSLFITIAAAWLPFIAAGYFNDSIREALLSRLNFLLVLADIQFQRLEGEAKASGNETKVSAIYNRQISNVVGNIDTDLGQSVDTLTKDKEEKEVNIIELYGDHRNLCRDITFCLNNTFNGVSVAGLEMTISISLSFGTVILSLLGILTRYSGNLSSWV